MNTETNSVCVAPAYDVLSMRSVLQIFSQVYVSELEADDLKSRVWSKSGVSDSIHTRDQVSAGACPCATDL